MLKSDEGGLTVYLDGLYEYALPAASETVMGEVGYINDALTHADTTVVLGRSYNNPVVFAQPISQDENDVAVVRITDIQADRFTLHVDEAPNHDGAHTTEAVSYIVLEAGSWELADGTLLEVGTVETAATVGSALSDQWESVLFSQEFTVAPVVLSQVQTDNDPHWVKGRQQIATTSGVNLALEEEEGKSTPHGAETVGWLAIEPGVGEWSGRLYEAAVTPDAVTHSWYSFSFSQSFSAAPRFLAGLASYDSDESAHLRYRRAQLTAAGAQVRVEEDSVFDSEYGHTTETAAYLAIEGNGELSATGGMSGPASTTYYETQGGALAMRRAGYPVDNGIFYILSDHLGSSSVILGRDGTVVKRDYYYPYGGNRGTPYTDVTTKRFTGQYHEAGLPGGEGLSYFNARWYDPQLGRFISADSIVPEPNRPQDFNRYTYARGNPVKQRDPTGHRTCSAQQASTGDETCSQNYPKWSAAEANYHFWQTLAQVKEYYWSGFRRPYEEDPPITSRFGQRHPKGVDWGGEFTVFAPARGIVTAAGADDSAGMWRIQHNETGDIREWSLEKGSALKESSVPKGHLLEPVRLLNTGLWTDIEPGWSHSPIAPLTTSKDLR